VSNPVHEAAQSGFTEGAASYVRGRPEYPDALQAWLCGQLGLGPGKLVIEPGAGTGKFTRSLLLTGAQVLAVEPVHAMRALLTENAPAACAVEGSAQSIPVQDATADAVVCAQCFHWFATVQSLTEFHRVLKPGGALGLVWNIPDERRSWVGELCRILAPFEAAAPHQFRHGTWHKVFPDERFSELQLTEYAQVHSGSARQVIIERARSLSYIANLPASEQAEVILQLENLVASQAELRGPGPIDFPYRTLAYFSRRR
jgi:SAM-dependent methyltransferase